MRNPAFSDPTTPSAVAPALAEEPPQRWRILVLLAFTQLLGMSLWFTASATSSQLAALWNLEPGEAAALTTAVQLGFVAGTALAALFNLADIIPARSYMAISAILAEI